MCDWIMNGVKVVFFDVDNTLYPSSSGLRDALDARVESYLTKRLHVSPSDARRARLNYEKHGTCLNGLVAESPSAFIVDEFVAEVYSAVDYGAYLREDASLRATLDTVRATRRVWAFSSHHRAHVDAVLRALGVRGVFEGVVEAVGLGYVAKPRAEAFEMALRAAGDCEPREALLVDDGIECVRAARSFGMQAVHVSNALELGEGKTYAPLAAAQVPKGASAFVVEPHQLRSFYPDLMVQRAHF